MSLFRLTHVRNNEISWDVLGYYIYLPATFIQKDPTLQDISWLKKQNEEKNLTGTYYMISQNDKGENMYFFLMGMSGFYAPSFALSHLAASTTGAPADGFSMPYQYGLVIGALIYTLIGLLYFRKILLRYLSEHITTSVLIIITIGTNYIHHLTIDNLGTVNILFMLVSLITWNTIRWQETQNYYRLLPIGIFSVLVALVKPSEVFVIFIPLLWGVSSFPLLLRRLQDLVANWKVVLLTVLLCCLIVSPQLYYWYLKTGKILYDSYKNPGVGLDVLSPHIVEVLFSYRKGWLVYTPVMILSILGFIVLYLKNKKIFFPLFVYFIISFYIIASWTEWWYGAAFSSRPMIALYPILGISLGYFLQFISSQNKAVKYLTLLFIVCCIFLNQFQWWQMREYILDPYRTTKEYYWRTFLKTFATPEDRTHLLVARDFTGKMEFTTPELYTSKIIFSEVFDTLSMGDSVSTTGLSMPFRLSSEQEFYPLIEKPYAQLSEKDHFWIKTKLRVRYTPHHPMDFSLLVNTMEREEGSYGYITSNLTFATPSADWMDIEVFYLTPELRSRQDIFKQYIWNWHRQNVEIQSIEISIYERRD